MHFLRHGCTRWLPLLAVPLGLLSASSLRAGSGAVEFPPVRTVALNHAGVSLRFAGIPAGSFAMGTAADSPRFQRDEGPLTVVEFTRPYWLGQTEVTQEQWEAMGFAHKSYHSGKDLPVTNITWEQAMEFCRKLTKRERAAGRLPDGYAYTLPTEAQWEYACRAGTSTVTYGGDLTVRGENDAPELDAVSWYAGNSSQFYNGRGWNTAAWPQKQYPGGTAGIRRVAGKKPNAWGFYDMIGNVMEWTGDWYAGYATGSVTDPAGPPSGEVRVYRGGAWNSSAIWCRAANRAGSEPGIRHVNLGFRPALIPVRQ